MKLKTLIVYGGILTLGAVVWHNITSQENPSVPSAEKLEPGHSPGMLARWRSTKPICDRDEDIRKACNELKKEYRHLSDDVIDFMVRLSQHYKHEKPSGLLGLLLTESRGDIYNINGTSSAVGGLQTILPTLSERITADRKLAPTLKHARAAERLIANVKTHFPHNPGIVDEFVTTIVDFNKAQKADLSTMGILKSMKMSSKHPDMILLKEGIKDRRAQLAKTLIEKYPHVLLAVQAVDVLTRYTPDQLSTGAVYQEYVLGEGGGPMLDKLIAGKAQRLAEAAEQKKVIVLQPAISDDDRADMLYEVNRASKRLKFSNIIIPKKATPEIYAAFLPEFEDVAPGNYSLFFDIQETRKVVVIKAKQKGEQDTKKTIVTRNLVPKTIEEVKEAIHKRRLMHDAKAQSLDKHVKRVTASAANQGYAPTAPNLVRIAQVEGAVLARN